MFKRKFIFENKILPVDEKYVWYNWEQNHEDETWDDEEDGGPDDDEVDGEDGETNDGDHVDNKPGHKIVSLQKIGYWILIFNS